MVRSERDRERHGRLILHVRVKRDKRNLRSSDLVPINRCKDALLLRIRRNRAFGRIEVQPAYVAGGCPRERRRSSRSNIEVEVAKGDERIECYGGVRATVLLRALIWVVTRPGMHEQAKNKKEVNEFRYHVPAVFSGVIRIAPGNACFRVETFVIAGMLMVFVSKNRYYDDDPLTYSP